MEQILNIVENCSKKRFFIENFDGDLYIRANQGHSLKTVDIDMVELTTSENFDICIHGTFYKAWELIKQTVNKIKILNTHLNTKIIIISRV